MGPKYEFTDKTINYDGHILHEIRRLSDGEVGGWIESEENLSQEGNCWVDNMAMVYDDARISGNAYIYENAEVFGHAKVYGNAKVYGHAKVYGNAEVSSYAIVYGNAIVYDNARITNEALVYDKAQVYGNAQIFGAKIHGNAKVFGYAFVVGVELTGEKYDEDLQNKDSSKEIIQDFIYKVDDSNKITAQTEYDSIDEFFNEPIKNDIKLDTLVICTVDTKEPLIKLQKVETDNKTEFKFIVDITNEDGDDFRFRSIIKSQEQLSQLIQQTIEALKLYPKFSKYADDLENCE